ncbi:YibE/F family protein [Murimonas intestini]|uniref:Membrane protein n=1 Tax=Murimonas intestini TaxID=1337051 RepID=A0AB73SZA1_9FIRM|nr:YibE/F family protein [Murimonas intestini]MCR1842853.1 YibE/F family protein [Murimonas intestini]MCR1868182.1 YibE/F family protein [Murimonas intestini]MCR1885326.1 YibE/F family protein [Murimonas intestini]
MFNKLKGKDRKISRESVCYQLPVIFCLALVVLLLILPTGFEDAVIYKGTERCAAEVVSVNDSKIISTGLIKSGEQTCTVKFLGGAFKGQEADGFNMLSGSLQTDKIFQVGDKVLVVISHNGGEIMSVNLIDHYRLNKEWILAGCFVLLLILFAGKTGIRAVLSFVITVLMIWKVMVPAYLNGMQPVLVGLGIVLGLTVIIISLVYGFDRRSLSAVCGSFLGIITTCILGIIFTDAFKIHGAIMSNSESLLYSGYEHLNLTQIFMASIFIGSSGAVMDLAVDITSAVNEVVEKKPDIGWREAVRSGMAVGRAAMGTMTTTLLLAYSGGCVALLMVFMAQGTPLDNILNYKYVSSEILDTIVGSFGLVTVAPFTALTSGFFLASGKQGRKIEKS